MPISGSLISSAIQSQFLLRNISGRNAIDIAGAVGSSLAKYIILPNLVTCSLNGTAGPVGNINSVAVIGLVPAAMSNFMYGKSLSKQIKGRDIKKIFDSISTGIVQILVGMILSGSAAGIAVGGGVGTFSAVNEQALSKILLAELKLRNIKGRDSIKFGDCISFGVVKHLQSSVKFTTIVTGAVAPVPPAGPVAVIGIPSLFTKVS